MSNPYVGEIRMFGGSFAPVGWMFCEGQLLPISEFDTLFNLIGTTYGGDGESTFALPDLRGRLPLHQTSGFQIGQRGGVEEVTLTVGQIPGHRHAFGVVDTHPGSQNTPSGNVAAASYNVVPFINDAPTGSFAATAISSAGGSQPHTNLQPYLCVDFIISLFGIFPSQT